MPRPDDRAENDEWPRLPVQVPGGRWAQSIKWLGLGAVLVAGTMATHDWLLVGFAVAATLAGAAFAWRRGDFRKVVTPPPPASAGGPPRPPAPSLGP